jgi:hypothetical protein
MTAFKRNQRVLVSYGVVRIMQAVGGRAFCPLASGEPHAVIAQC